MCTNPQSKQEGKDQDRNNQTAKLTKDTAWESDIHLAQERQEVRHFPAGDHKARQCDKDTLGGNVHWILLQSEPIFTKYHLIHSARVSKSGISDIELFFRCLEVIILESLYPYEAH